MEFRAQTRSLTIRTGIILTAFSSAILVGPAFADCAADLAEVDQLLAEAEAGGSATEPQMMQVLRTFRDQGAASCAAGDETNAETAFTSVKMMLTMTQTPAAPPREMEAGDDQAREDQPAAVAATDGAYELGEPRGDLARFHGIYGGDAGRERDIFVADAKLPPGSERPIPPGYLMVGGMGDAAALYMKSLAETAFEQQWVSDYQDSPVVIEFELDEDGVATALVFKSFYAERGRLPRLGDLPDGW
jgi:hypothetical protein